MSFALHTHTHLLSWTESTMRMRPSKECPRRKSTATLCNTAFIHLSRVQTSINPTLTLRNDEPTVWNHMGDISAWRTRLSDLLKCWYWPKHYLVSSLCQRPARQQKPKIYLWADIALEYNPALCWTIEWQISMQLSFEANSAQDCD